MSFQTNANIIPPAYLYGTGNATDTSTAVTSVFGPSGALDTATQAQNASQQNVANVPNLVNGQTVSWTLLFDRTYDLIYSDPRVAGFDSDLGVLKDVAALYNIMGTFETQAAVPVSTPVQVAFAQTPAGGIFGFTGYIQNLSSITYGIFNGRMIPSRCEIQISMMTTYVPPTVPSAWTAPAAAPAPPALSAAGQQALKAYIGFGSQLDMSVPPQSRYALNSSIVKMPNSSGTYDLRFFVQCRVVVFRLRCTPGGQGSVQAQLVAAQLLGNPALWWAIFDINPEIIDPLNVPAGAIVRIPATPVMGQGTLLQ